MDDFEDKDISSDLSGNSDISSDHEKAFIESEVSDNNMSEESCDREALTTTDRELLDGLKNIVINLVEKVTENYLSDKKHTRKPLNISTKKWELF